MVDPVVIVACTLGSTMSANLLQEPKIRIPPASVIAQAFMTLVSEGPVGTDDVTTVSINWIEGAYYMVVVRGEPRKRWKLMLVPPQAGSNWQIKRITGTGRAQETVTTPGNPEANRTSKDATVDWSQQFAGALAGLPELYRTAPSFKIRAIPESDRVVFFHEISYPVPAWVIFTVGPGGAPILLDLGF